MCIYKTTHNFEGVQNYPIAIYTLNMMSDMSQLHVRQTHAKLKNKTIVIANRPIEVKFIKNQKILEGPELKDAMRKQTVILYQIPPKMLSLQIFSTGIKWGLLLQKIALFAFSLCRQSSLKNHCHLERAGDFEPVSMSLCSSPVLKVYWKV